jgi:acid phosphatase
MIARLVVSLTAALFACAPTAVAEPPAPPSPIVPPPVQPANIGDLKTEATQYYDSGSYLIDLQLAAWPAIPWINEEAARVDRPAVVFDIDETALSNWEPSRPTTSAASSAALAMRCRKVPAVGRRGT